MRFSFLNRFFRDPRFWLVLVPIVVYANSLTGEFVYDDREMTVENNPALTGEASVWEILQWDRPLREFTYMLDHFLWGFRPFGYHVQNLVWHCANGLLIYALLQILGVARWVAFWSALLFSLHPINTEAVAWISGRKELLCLFFELCACLCFMKAFQKNRFVSWDYLGCLLACGFALLSKQVAVALPILMAASIWLQGRLWNEELDVRKSAKYLAGPCFIVLATILFRYPIFQQLGFTQEHGTFYDPASRDVAYTFLAALLTPFATLLKSFWLCVWPMDLTIEQAFQPVTQLADPRWMMGAFVIFAMLICAAIWRKKRPALLFGLAWFIAAWAPVSGAVPVSYLMADRYLYIPCVGFCLVGVVVLQPLLLRFDRKVPRFSLIVGTVVCLAFSLRTVARNLDWRDEISLWQSAVHSRPMNAKVHSGLASAYAEQGNTEGAFQEWELSLEIDPKQPRVWVNRGNEEQRQGNLEEAERCYRKALEEVPQYGAAHFNLALLLEQQQKVDEALSHFQLAAQYLYHRSNTAHRKGLAHYHIARLLFAKGETRAALYQIVFAEKLAPTFAPLYLLKGLLHQNNPELARQAFEEALHLDPDYAEAFYNLGVLEWQQGNRNKADEYWKKAVQLNPSLTQPIDLLKKNAS